MADKIVEFMRALIGNDVVTTCIVSALPLVELRYALPLGIKMGVDPIIAFLLSYLGASLVCPILFFILRPVLNLMKKMKWFYNLATSVEQIFEEKSASIAEKSAGETGSKANKIKFWGVLLFVAIPLPLTGVWTGTAIAVFLNMKPRHAIPAVLLGNLIAASIILALSVFFAPYIDVILNAFLIIVVVVLITWIVKLVLKTRKNSKQKN